VGPNEAGKSSILKALTFLSDNSEYSAQDRYKFSDDVEIEVRAVFHLESEDHEAIGSHLPKRYTLWKVDDGSLYHRLEPRIEREKQHRNTLKADLAKSLGHRLVIDQIDSDEYELDEILKGVSSLNLTKENYSQSELKLLTSCKHMFDSLSLSGAPKYLQGIAERIDRFIEIEKRPHPHDEAIEEIEKRVPSFVEFTDEDRTLDPSFNVNLFEHENAQQAVEPCNALKNLCEISGLDLHRLKQNLTEKKIR